MQADLVQFLGPEQAVAANRGVARGHGLQRPAAQIPGEDDVDDVLRGEAPHRRDRVDDRDGPLHGRLVDPDLFRELAMERVDEALARVDPAAR